MKRDLKRIDPLMKRLTAVWKKSPELRLGQLLYNAMNDTDFYYTEDDKLIQEIELYNAGYYTTKSGNFE